MSTVGLVAGAVTAVCGIAAWFLNRKTQRDEKAKQPIEQKRRRDESIAREVAADDERGANVSLDDDLRRVRELQNGSSAQGDRERPDGQPGERGH